MRIEKKERIILSQDEHYTWTEFEDILLELARETQDPNTEKTILKIQDLLNDLWEGMEAEVE